MVPPASDRSMSAAFYDKTIGLIEFLATIGVDLNKSLRRKLVGFLRPQCDGGAHPLDELKPGDVGRHDDRGGIDITVDQTTSKGILRHRRGVQSRDGKCCQHPGGDESDNRPRDRIDRMLES